MSYFCKALCAWSVFFSFHYGNHHRDEHFKNRKPLNTHHVHIFSLMSNMWWIWTKVNGCNNMSLFWKVSNCFRLGCWADFQTIALRDKWLSAYSPIWLPLVISFMDVGGVKESSLHRCSDTRYIFLMSTWRALMSQTASISQSEWCIDMFQSRYYIAIPLVCPRDTPGCCSTHYTRAIRVY